MVLVAQVTGRVGRCRGFLCIKIEQDCLKKTFTALAILGILSSPSFARDLGVLALPVHQGKWTSSLLYEYLKVREDFDTRGRADFTGHVVGSQFSYGITDQVALAINGGVLVDPQEDAQGSQWQS